MNIKNYFSKPKDKTKNKILNLCYCEPHVFLMVIGIVALIAGIATQAVLNLESKFALFTIVLFPVSITTFFTIYFYKNYDSEKTLTQSIKDELYFYKNYDSKKTLTQSIKDEGDPLERKDEPVVKYGKYQKQISAIENILSLIKQYNSESGPINENIYLIETKFFPDVKSSIIKANQLNMGSEKITEQLSLIKDYLMQYQQDIKNHFNRKQDIKFKVLSQYLSR